MRKWIVAGTIFLFVGCDTNAKLTLDECMKDVDCKSASDEAVQANRTVHLTCPANPNETSPACESAMGTLDTAEQRACEKLTKDDCFSFTQSLMAVR